MKDDCSSAIVLFGLFSPHFSRQLMMCLQELKFGIGDGKLNYYLYNWRVQREMAPQQVGLVLL
jgi:Myristoyl-CoA:protein N-myristoyltransferase, C-terminal domain